MSKKKRLAPKTLNWRKYFLYAVILFAIFASLGSIRAFSLAEKVDGMQVDQPKTQVEVKQNLATSDGAQTFAEKFAAEYFKWDRSNFQERAERLQPYLREGTHDQAGLLFDGLTGNSQTLKTEIVSVKDTSDNTADITIHAVHEIETPATKDAKGKPVKGTKSGSIDKYIIVPVITDGKGFLINAIPTFTSKPEKPIMAPVEEKTGEVLNDNNITKAVQTSLESFFKNYTTGTNEDLAFFTNDESIRSLQGTVSFEKIEKVTVYEGKSDSFEVTAEVTFIDAASKGKFKQQYELIVSKKDDRYIVEKIKR
jgi:Conjugative transposon protein TcpC